jgi:hypothetical protein
MRSRVASSRRKVTTSGFRIIPGSIAPAWLVGRIMYRCRRRYLDVRCRNVRTFKRATAEHCRSRMTSMYPASDWSVAPGHHGYYQRACGLISGQVSMDHSGHQVRIRSAHPAGASR